MCLPHNYCYGDKYTKGHLCETLAILVLSSRVSLHRHMHAAVHITPGPCVHFYFFFFLFVVDFVIH